MICTCKNEMNQIYSAEGYDAIYWCNKCGAIYKEQFDSWYYVKGIVISSCLYCANFTCLFTETTKHKCQCPTVCEEDNNPFGRNIGDVSVIPHWCPLRGENDLYISK